jgi:P4 family phage/plasmid primase-like protien
MNNAEKNGKSNTAHSLPIHPTTPHSKHITEWQKSGISDELIEINLISIQGNAVYEAVFDFTEPDRRNDGRLRDKDLKRYEDPAKGGWIFYTIDVATGQKSDFFQFKPDEPHHYIEKDSGKEKIIKYETPKGARASEQVLALKITEQTWQKIGERCGIAPSCRIDLTKYDVTVQYYQWLKDNPSIPLFITEGVKKVGCLLSMGYCAVAVTGWSLLCQKDDQAKMRRLNPQLEILCQNRQTIFFTMDCDEKKKAQKDVTRAVKQATGCIKVQDVETQVLEVKWNPEQGKGVDDFVTLNGTEEFHKLVKKAKPISPISPEHGFIESDREYDPKSAKPFDPRDYGLPRWFHSEIASHIAGKYRDVLAWNTDIQEWYKYGAKWEGIWSIAPSEKIGSLILLELNVIVCRYQEILESRGQSSLKYGGFSHSFLAGVEKLLKLNLACDDWETPRYLIPFNNGVLNRQTKEFFPHSAHFRLTWCLPYDYNPLATCDPIKEWMMSQFGDAVTVEVIRAYLHGIVTGRTDWQKYLELIGPGGTGKGTLHRLAIALVGVQNVHTTTLKKLEESRFETASIKDKRLVLITDSERYGGGCSILKALTGQDTLPYEKKGKQSTEGFIPEAMVLIAANEHIQSADYTSGLTRRRVTIGMNRQVDSNDTRNLIEIQKESIKGEFVPFIPGLLNWVLWMDSIEATDLMKNHALLTPSLAKAKAEALIESNPIAAWADVCIVHKPKAVTYVGSASKPVEQYLYASYHSYCLNNGFKPVNNARFSKLLHDLVVNQLKLDVKRHKDKKGAHFINLAIRDEFTSEPLLITVDCCKNDSDDGLLKKEVTVKTLANDRGDGDDGYLISPEIPNLNNIQSTVVDSQLTEPNPESTGEGPSPLPENPETSLSSSVDGINGHTTTSVPSSSDKKRTFESNGQSFKRGDLCWYQTDRQTIYGYQGWSRVDEAYLIEDSEGKRYVCQLEDLTPLKK